MIGKTSDSVQSVQSVLRRTHLGRILSKSAQEAADSWAQSQSRGYGKSECKVCGLILKSNYFVRGCLNCGSTDVNQL